MLSARNGSSRWDNFLRSFKSPSEKHDKKEDKELKEIVVTRFDKKFKVVIECEFDSSNYIEACQWLDENTSGLVRIEWLPPFPKGDSLCASIGFEDPDDALVFRIKFGV